MPVPTGNQSKAMNLEESTYELLERYLNKECSVDEVQSVQERIASDAVFAKEVEWFRQFRQDMKERTSFALLEELEKMKREDEDRVKRKKLRLVSILAFTLFILLCLSIWLWPRKEATLPIAENPRSENFEEQLSEWEQYLEYKRGLQTLGEEDDSNLKQAQQYIEAEQPKEALPFLSAYLDALPEEDDDYEMRLEYGKILLREMFDTDQAKQVFSGIITSPALPLFKEAASFYLGMSHLLSGQKDSSIIIWEEIIQRADHPFHKQVKDILNRQVSQ